MTLEELKKSCDVVEGYVDLGLFNEAFKFMRSFSSELGITSYVEQFVNGVMKMSHSMRPSYLSEARNAGATPDIDRMLLVAHLRCQAGDFRAALEWLTIVEALCVGSADFHHLSYQCYAGLGDLEQAAKSLQKSCAMSDMPGRCCPLSSSTGGCR